MLSLRAAILSRFARRAVRGTRPRSEAVSWMCPEAPIFVEAPTPHADRLRYAADDTVSYATLNEQQVAYLRTKCGLGTCR